MEVSRVRISGSLKRAFQEATKLGEWVRRRRVLN